MDVKTMVTTAFDAEVKRVFSVKEDIYKFIDRHPRKQMCLDNIVTEIRKLELSGLFLDKDRIDFMGRTFAQTFSRAALQYRERELMTSLQKDIEEKKSAEHQYFQKLIEDTVQETTAYEELGETNE